MVWFGFYPFEIKSSYFPISKPMVIIRKALFVVFLNFLHREYGTIVFKRDRGNLKFRPLNVSQGPRGNVGPATICSDDGQLNDLRLLVKSLTLCLEHRRLRRRGHQYR